MTASRYCGRFAPTPSGPLHFGSLLAALASFLDARHHGGQWLLRIDDVDCPRVLPGAADRILRDLDRHGLYWDGVVRYQSQHLEDYRTALARLAAAGLTYRCTCTRRELRQFASSDPAGIIYPGFCRNGPRHQRRRAAIRLKVPDAVIGFADLLQGRFEQNLVTDVGDFVLRRSDGLYAYQLAVVVDDAAQGVTHVVRGSDLLDSTPRQIYLQRQLGLSEPAYLHIPIGVDRRGQKLSKQTCAKPLDHDRPASALVAALKLLGQHPPVELSGMPPPIILEWAAAQWSSSRIPRRRELAPPPVVTEPD